MRRVGYVSAIVFSLIMGFIANNVLDWGWFSWLTADFEELLLVVNISIAITIAVNLVFLFYKSGTVAAGGELLTAVASFVVVFRTWHVYPFEVTGWWNFVFRAFLLIGILGTIVAVIVNTKRLFSGSSFLQKVGNGAR